jgi:hypothetical protein
MKRSNTKWQVAKKTFMQIVDFLPIEVVESDSHLSEVLRIIKTNIKVDNLNCDVSVNNFTTSISIYGYFDEQYKVINLNCENTHQVAYQMNENNNYELCYYNLKKHNVLKYHEIENSDVVNASLLTIDLNGNIVDGIHIKDDEDITHDVYNTDEPYNLESSYVEDYGHQKIYHK